MQFSVCRLGLGVLLAECNTLRQILPIFTMICLNITAHMQRFVNMVTWVASHSILYMCNNLSILTWSCVVCYDMLCTYFSTDAVIAPFHIVTLCDLMLNVQYTAYSISSISCLAHMLISAHQHHSLAQNNQSPHKT